MKKSAISTLALMLVLAAGCSTDPGGGGGLDIPGVDTVPPDTTIDQGGDGPVNPDACPGGTCPDTDEDAPCENKCEPGQVLCTTETRFKACEEGPDGCLDFVGATTFCDGANHEVCICWTGEDEANWCLPEGEPCQCIPACDGKDCGPDGCGDTCGECREEQVCNLDTGVCEGEDPDQTCAECVTSCEPGGDGINCCEEGQQTCNGAKVISCEDKYPEDEGCDCWKWLDPAGSDCPDPFMACQPLPGDLGACLCTFLTCDTGCCSSAAFTACDPQGDCCIPDCQGKECGDDGCGGSCGACPEDTYCDLDTATCKAECESVCTPAGKTSCQGEFAYKTCVEVQVGGQPCLVWDPALTQCPPNNVCEDGACVCQPNCLGKNCGPDGCGGNCGSCQLPFQCVDGNCACECEDLWQPVCDEDTCETWPNWCEAACAGVTNLTQGPCACGCTADCTEDEWAFGPLCGVDGVTYDSFCQLKCEDDVYDNGCLIPEDCDLIDSVGECGGLEPCTGCPANYNPVCAANGVTYWNYCCFTKLAGGAAYFCQGECLDPVACPGAPAVCAPVCGLSGEGQQISYMNSAVRDCMEAMPLYDAACCDGTPLWEDWVCTDNGGTYESYQNEDIMSCVNPVLQVLYDIPQDAFGSFLVDVCEQCSCDLSGASEATWLCGSDFSTYPNQCALTCYADPPALSAVPLCDSGCGFGLDECPCPPAVGGAQVANPLVPADSGARGVCGDDGATYGSICDATYNGALVVVDEWCEECEATCQGEPWAPLCCKLPGMDTGATYANACIVQNCSTVYETGDCFTGECCLDEGDCDDKDPATVDTCNPLNFVCDHV